MKKDIAVKQAGSLPEPEPAAPETVYWLETCGGRPRLTAGTPEEWKRIEHFADTTKISPEVYEKAKSAFSLDWLGCFEKATIERWQQEFDAQTEAETMPEPAPVKPEKAAADKPMAAPKQPASRKIPKADTGKWQSAGIGKQIYRCNF
jgi:hypothetical protein